MKRTLLLVAVMFGVAAVVGRPFLTTVALAKVVMGRLDAQTAALPTPCISIR